MTEEPQGKPPGPESTKVQMPAEPLDYRKELLDLADTVASLSLQLQLATHNLRARIKDQESKQGIVP